MSSVSVVIPVYNGEAFLAEAIESVLRQDPRPMEIIVVDDGSTDGTAQIAANFIEHVKYVYQPNSGPPAARNRGLKMVQGDVIAFLDADDLWPENKLRDQLVCFAQDPSTEIVLGLTQRLLKNGKKYMEPLLGHDFGSALFKRSVFDKVGLLDGSKFQCDDWDWFLRAREMGVAMATCQAVTRYHRRHENNITNHEARGNHYMLQTLKQSLDRRRKCNGKAVSLPRPNEAKDSR